MVKLYRHNPNFLVITNFKWQHCQCYLQKWPKVHLSTIQIVHSMKRWWVGYDFLFFIAGNKYSSNIKSVLGRHLDLTSSITSSTGGHSSHPSHLAAVGSSNQQQQLPSSSSLHLHAPHAPPTSSALKSPASAAALFSHFYDGGSNPVTLNRRLQPPPHLYPRSTSTYN